MSIRRLINHAVAIAAVTCTGVQLAAATGPAPKGSPNIRIPICDFTYQLEWKGPTVYDPEYWPWDLFVLKATDGRYHGFGTRVKDADMPMSTRNPGVKDILYGHLKFAEIAHYIADKPEGPFRFADLSLSCPRDGNTKLFPSVHRDANRWVMMYTNHCGDEKGRQGKNMRVCMAVADSLNGPWRDLGAVIGPSTDPKHWTHGSGYGMKVGQMLQFRGKWYAYFKTWVKGKEYAGDFVGAATADRPEGPWTIADKPAILKEGTHPQTYLEDMGVFVWGERVYMMILDHGDQWKDKTGSVSGVRSGVLLFSSDDGLTFPWDRAKLMADTGQYHCPMYDRTRAVTVWGPKSLFFLDTPRVLLVDGVPTYLYFSSGTNVEGEPKSANYCLKIPKWAP